MSQPLLREKGSSTHNPRDPMCSQYAEGEATTFGDVCEVCAGRTDARHKARFFLDHVVREIGS